MTCTVAAGTPWAAMQQALAQHNQCVALDPLFADCATIGGILAVNDSGALRSRYGSLRDLVIGMTIVLADGTIARSGGKVVKNVAGYDLPKLLTGSFGTLGIITEVNFRLHPIQQHAETWTVALYRRAALAALSATTRQRSDEHREPSTPHRRRPVLTRRPLRITPRSSPRTRAAPPRSLHLINLKRADDSLWQSREQLFANSSATILKIATLPTKSAAILEAFTHSRCPLRRRLLRHHHRCSHHARSTTRSPHRDLRARLSADGGMVVVLRSPETFSQTFDRWGGSPPAIEIMRAIKQQFDPNASSTPASSSEASSDHTHAGLAPHQPCNSPSSAFDAHHPPALLIDKCVHCGFCLPACPTYVLWGEEMDSPRGRIWMMRKAAQGEATLDQEFRTHMDNCLGCMACMTACPSGVEYNKLIEDTRAQVERHIPRATTDSLSAACSSTPSPTHAASAFSVSRCRSTNASACKNFSARPASSSSCRNAFAQWKTSSARPAQPLPFTANIRHSKLAHSKLETEQYSSFNCIPWPRGHAHRLRTGRLLLHVNAATARVLAAEGFEVIIPQQQGCCGALMVHSGLEDRCHRLRKKIIANFETTQVDTIVINAAGCGSTMKEYGHLLRDEPDWAERAAAFCARCKDISELLAEHAPIAPRHPLPIRVAYHDACHLRHAQGIHAEPRALLAEHPRPHRRRVPEASLCCGSAGVYNLLHPEPAQELADRKVHHLLSTNAEAVISANPGCLLQLMSGLRRLGHNELPTFHMIEFLDASIRGLSREELLHGKRSTSV